jgi:hypothetical protein
MKTLRGIQALRQRYPDTCDRTFDRWIQRGVLPRPVYILGRRYWSDQQLDEFDAAREQELMAKAVATKAAA